MKRFVEAQGFDIIDLNILYHDNKSTIKIAKDSEN